MRLEPIAPGAKAVVLSYPVIPKIVLSVVGLAIIYSGVGLINELKIPYRGSLIDLAFECIMAGVILGFGAIFLVEPTKEVTFRGRQMKVAWLGGIYVQRYSLVHEMTIELEHREDPRYGVRERLKICQGHLKCTIPSSMHGFEVFCTHLRAII